MRIKDEIKVTPGPVPDLDHLTIADLLRELKSRCYDGNSMVLTMMVHREADDSGQDDCIFPLVLAACDTPAAVGLCDIAKSALMKGVFG